MHRGALQTLGNERHLERDKEEERGQRRRQDPGSLAAPQAPATSTAGVIPVFVFPAELAFYADDQSSHKQVLTLYNPFVSVLKFKVLSTAPSRYTVVDAEGRVKPQSCIDIVVRHKDISARHYGTTDRFRIEVSEEGNRKNLGRKEITSALHPTKRELYPTIQRRPLRETIAWQPQHILPAQQASARPLSPALFSLYLLVGVICIAFLMLPLQGEMSTLVPENLHATVIQKLVSAYVLGLLTMVFLQG
ncbi:motile sperm domain-containing protein 1-like isoform X2 [Ambystoma mexicanum]|uniref:motile sperm domain-containing protein 1-like isoform X2 n=1 Tax=Ambystoma mexicanum TaxID=8296 RepID=UPI0037E965A2